MKEAPHLNFNVCDKKKKRPVTPIHGITKPLCFVFEAKASARITLD